LFRKSLGEKLSSDSGKSKEHLGSYGAIFLGGIWGALGSYELSFLPWKCYIIAGWFMDVYGFVALEYPLVMTNIAIENGHL